MELQGLCLHLALIIPSNVNENARFITECTRTIFSLKLLFMTVEEGRKGKMQSWTAIFTEIILVHSVIACIFVSNRDTRKCAAKPYLSEFRPS